jgi:hypothetical protein
MSTTRDDLREELATRLEAYLSVDYPDVKALYSNQKFAYPNPPTVFLTSETDEFMARQTALGQPKKLKMFRGFWVIEIFAPENTGSKKAMQIADGLEEEFGGTQFKTESCGTVTLQHSICRDDRLTNGWHRWTVTFDYRIQQTG